MTTFTIEYLVAGSLIARFKEFRADSRDHAFELARDYFIAEKLYSASIRRVHTGTVEKA